MVNTVTEEDAVFLVPVDQVVDIATTMEIRGIRDERYANLWQQKKEYPEILDGYYSYPSRRLEKITEGGLIQTGELIQSKYEGVFLTSLAINVEVYYKMEEFRGEKDMREDHVKQLQHKELDEEMKKSGVAMATYTTEHDEPVEDEVIHIDPARIREGVDTIPLENLDFRVPYVSEKYYTFTILRGTGKGRYFRERFPRDLLYDLEGMFSGFDLYLLNAGCRKPKDNGRLNIFVNASPVVMEMPNRGEVQDGVSAYCLPNARANEILGYGKRRLAKPLFGQPIFLHGKEMGVLVNGNNLYIYADPAGKTRYGAAWSLLGVILHVAEPFLSGKTCTDADPESIAQAIFNVNKRVVRRRKKAFLENVSAQKEQCDHYLEKYKAKYIEYRAALEKTNDESSFSIEDAVKEVNALARDKNITNFRITGNMLTAHTRNIAINNPSTDELHWIGRVEIIIDMSRFRVDSIYNLDHVIDIDKAEEEGAVDIDINDGVWESVSEEDRKLALVGPQPHGFQAPHVENGNACFGNMRVAIEQTLVRGMFGTAVSLIFSFLNSAEMGDAYGAKLVLWPTISLEKFKQKLAKDKEEREEFLNNLKKQEEVNA